MSVVADATRMGAVHLTVADLARSLDYYDRVLGLQLHERDNGVARLGAGGDDLLVLYEQPGAQPAPRNTGLFHFALLLPSRYDLARWLMHAVRNEIPLTGMSDHLVSEALYLRDPDAHGIEIYRDRPRSEWERDGDGVRMATLPLDAQGLVAEIEGEDAGFEQMPPATTMGHVHLQVADTAATEAFYVEQIGFDVMARYGREATFMSAGGYHHHLGGNTWNSAGDGPPPEGAAALRHATLLVPDAGERDRVAGRVADGGQDPEERDDGVLVRDPSGNALLIAVEPR